MNFSPRQLLKILAQGLYLQLFITLVSLPILIAWGLPVSMMTFVGNLIFTPFLSLILLLCSLIFFGNLMGLSMYPLMPVVDWVVHGWLWILSWGQPAWLVGFKKPSNLILCLLGVLPFVLLHSRATRTITRALVLFSLLLVSAVVYLKYIQMPTIEYSHLEHRSMPVHCIYHGKVTLVIPRVSAHNQEAMSKWVDYTLMPFLTKQTGLVRIAHLILLESNPARVELFLSVASKSLVIDRCYVIDKRLKHTQGLQYINGEFIFLLGHNNQLCVLPKKQKNDYRSTEILLTIDNVVTTLYSPKLRSPHHNMQKRSSNYGSQKSFAYRCA